MKGKCIECDYLEMLDRETGMCDYCTKQQKRHLNYMEAKNREKEERSFRSPIKNQIIRNDAESQKPGLADYDKYKLK